MVTSRTPSPPSAEYLLERNRVDMALRMLRLRARTRTIRYCTELSNDRIRRILVTYGSEFELQRRPRHRGKAPTSTLIFTKTPQHQLEASTIVALFFHLGVLIFDNDGKLLVPKLNGLELAHRSCRVYESYRHLYPNAHLSFEQCWMLLQDLKELASLHIELCDKCQACFLTNLLLAHPPRCPICHLLSESTIKFNRN